MPITIDKPSKYFNTLTWTGTGSSSGRSFTGVGFKPDLVWQKVRGTTYGHWIADAIRGSGKRLASNTTNGDESNSIYGYLTTFDTDGFTTVAGSTDNTGWNETSQTYVSWNWLGANTTASNTSGSITSTVSANTTSGFSIVSWTGAGASGTVGHGLGAVPKFIITKKRNNTGNWACYHVSLGNTQYIYLNSSNASATYSGFWNNTTPTSTLISLGTDDNVTGNGDNIIAYCFAEVKGYSAFGSYTGNGNADGTFVYTGFSPAWIMIKQSSTSGNGWIMMDNKRNTYNPNGDFLQANVSDAEDTSSVDCDFLSNGFKIRTASGRVNTSGATYIYACFAENPFVSSKGIPTIAR